MSGPILVTGAAGFAGGHLLDLLVRERAGDIVAWQRPGGTPSAQRAGVRWETVDLLDRDAVRASIEGARPRAVYHCAGAAHVGRSWQNTESTFAINVRGTHYLVEALREAGVRARLLIPSSAMVYAAAGEALTEDDPVVPSSPYALSKLAQEMTAAGNPDLPDASIARAFNHFGPAQDPSFVASGFARRIASIEAGRSEAEIPVGNLEARRDMTDVRDTARAYRLIVDHGGPGRVYNVCSGRAIQIGELLELMLQRARIRIRVRVDPARYRPNDVPLLLGSAKRIREELGWAPEIPLEQTIDDVLSYWRLREPQGSAAATRSGTIQNTKA